MTEKGTCDARENILGMKAAEGCRVEPYFLACHTCVYGGGCIACRSVFGLAQSMAALGTVRSFLGFWGVEGRDASELVGKDVCQPCWCSLSFPCTHSSQ